MKRWRKRWFVLQDSILYSFKNERVRARCQPALSRSIVSVINPLLRLVVPMYRNTSIPRK